MRKNKGIDDSKRLSLLHAYLKSDQTRYMFEKENGLSSGSISNWLCIFGLEDKPIPSLCNMNDSPRPSQSLEEEIAALRHALRLKDAELKQAQMARDAYETMIEIAEEKYAIPIRKNSDAK